MPNNGTLLGRCQHCNNPCQKGAKYCNRCRDGARTRDQIAKRLVRLHWLGVKCSVCGHGELVTPSSCQECLDKQKNRQRGKPQ